MMGSILVVAGSSALLVVFVLRPGPIPRRHASGPTDRPTDPVVADRHRGPAFTGRLQLAMGATAIVLAIVVLGPVLAVVVAAAVVGGRAVVLKSARRRRAAAVDRALPELVDLFRIAAGAGLPVASCLAAVAERAPVATQPSLRAAVDRIARGAPLTGELVRAGAALGTLGPAWADALVASALTGAPLLPALDRLAVTARDRRRRAAEHAARRLPVTLLFPLVLCVLPAFGLLAVVPLLVGSLSSLHV